MEKATLDPVEQAFRLIGTPLALEALDDLANDRSPGDRHHDAPGTLAIALDLLVQIGAAQPTQGSHVITPNGRALRSRLEEIEQLAGRHCDTLRDMN